MPIEGDRSSGVRCYTLDRISLLRFVVRPGAIGTERAVHNGDAMMVRSRLRRFLQADEFRRGALTLVGGATIGQAIVVVSSPVLTRLYAPAEVGAFSVALSIMLILTTVSSLRYEYAIPLPDADVDAANVLALSLILAVCTSIVAGLALSLAGPWFIGLFGAWILGPYVLLIAAGQAAGGVVKVFTMWAVRTRAYSEIAANRLTQSGTQVVVQVGLGLAGSGAPGLLVGAVAGNLGGSGRLARAAWRTHASAFRRVTRAGIGAAASRYRRFPIFSSWSALLNTLGEQAPLLVLVAVYGTAVGGQFALAQRVVALPVTLVAGAVAQVFFAEAARLAREEPRVLRQLFVRTTWKLIAIAIGPSVLLAILAPALARSVFGDDWTQAGLFVTILAPMYCMQLIASPTGGALDVLERQDLHLVRELLRLFVVGGAFFVAVTVNLAPVYFVLALSVAGCLTYAIYLFITWRAVVEHHETALAALVPEALLIQDIAMWPEP